MRNIFQLLASQSFFFDRLFNGYFMEKNMVEIPIGDVDYEVGYSLFIKKFSDMLFFLHLGILEHYRTVVRRGDCCSFLFVTFS